MRGEQTEGQSLSLFAIVSIILAFGLVMLGSATAPSAADKFGNAYHFLIRQVLFGLLPGAVLFIALRQVPISWWERSWKYMFGLSIVLLGLVFIPGLGLRINGSLSWIHVGSYSIQPAELVKFTFIVFLSGWLAQNKKLLSRVFSEGLLQYLIYVVAISGMILLQPDLGTVLVIFATAMILAFVAGAQMQHIGILAGLGALAVVILVAIAPYRLQRITVLFDPDKDPYGSGYHIKQSLIAVSGGGVIGMGLGNSRQKFQYLPEVSADSIFAVIAEEMGFIISTILISAYLLLVLKGYQLSRTAGSDWAKYFIIGTVSWIGVQTVLNIGAMLAIVPLTGLPLPLVSHGGTSLMVTLAAFGVISGIVNPPETAVIEKRRRL
jgi:cell division protein FtsW